MRRGGILIVGLALTLGACGEKTIDTDAAERTVTRVVAEESGFQATDMDCPSDVKAEMDGRFECHFTGPEGPYDASVRITEVDGDDATFSVTSRPSR